MTVRPTAPPTSGALQGITVIEMDGLGPAPFCAMILADMGAQVIRVERPPDSAAKPPADRRRRDTFGRGRRSVELDVKSAAGRDAVRALTRRADVLIEGFRPGVMERLGLGPDDLCAANPALVYGRMTGWGQTGPMAHTAGHDVNYISLAGALEPIGPADRPPVIPLSLVGDFGGGGMYLAVGILAALVERGRSGRGQIVDAACAEGASHLMTVVHHMRSLGRWTDTRGANLFDGGAPFYGVYRTADGCHLSVGAVEPKCYQRLLDTLELPEEQFHPQYRRDRWPQRRALLAKVFARRSRAAWLERFDGIEACVTPVLAPGDVPNHPQMRARAGFVNVDGFPEPAPAPRLSRTPSVARPRPLPGEHTGEVLAELRVPSPGP